MSRNPANTHRACRPRRLKVSTALTCGVASQTAQATESSRNRGDDPPLTCTAASVAWRHPYRGTGPGDTGPRGARQAPGGPHAGLAGRVDLMEVRSRWTA